MTEVPQYKQSLLIYGDLGNCSIAGVHLIANLLPAPGEGLPQQYLVHLVLSSITLADCSAQRFLDAGPTQSVSERS